MKRMYSYPTQWLWERNAWDCKLSPVQKLARWMAKEGILHREDPNGIPLPEDAVMDVRIGSFRDPEEEAKWRSRGMLLEFGHAGERWMTLSPMAVVEQKEHDPVTLFVLTDFCYTDDCWAMKITRAYRPLLDMAAREGYMLCFVNSIPSRVDLCILILREIAQRCNVNHSRLYMDMSALVSSGRRLSQVPDLGLKDQDGQRMEDPDAAIIPLGDLGVPVLDITGQWVSNDSLEFANFTPGRIGHLPFDYDRLVHSLAGERMAQAMTLEFDYDSAEDPAFQQRLRDMGLCYAYSEIDNRGWVCITPAAVQGERLPCMMILQEICKCDPHSIPSAMSLWYEYLKLAAMGEMMLIFFALEDVQSNDLLEQILDQAKERYPELDKNRVFITGHSHNGHYASAFARRHPDRITGVGTMGNPHSLSYTRDPVKLSPEEIDAWREMEFAWINVDGQWENTFSCRDLKPGDRKYLPEDERVECYQNRMRAFRCRVYSAEEILGAASHPDKARRMLGVPVDRAFIELMDGDECYTGDLVNQDGRSLLRLVTIENLPHATSSHMPWLTWNYLRRFARDPETRRIVEIK